MRMDCAGFVPNGGRLIGILCLLWGAGSPAWAQDASPWDTDLRSQARLIAASAQSQSGIRILRAGLAIKLLPGWKTYWRYPGDSGVPPVFDFSGSDNVKDVTVRYPAPQRFDDGGGGYAIGYHDGVIFPLQVTPQDATKPVTLRLKLSYAACQNACFPAKASAELTVTGAPTAFDDALAAAEARVPKASRIGDPGALAIRAVHREAAAKPKIVVDVAAPAGVAVDLFAEGPTADWALPLPVPVKGAPQGLQRFVFEIDGVPPGVKPEGVTLRLTGVAGDQAIEAAFRLD